MIIKKEKPYLSKSNSKIICDDNSSDNRYEFDEIFYLELMQKRIINILLICSKYDAFMLNNDGRINEKIYSHYTSKSLRSQPGFTHAVSLEEAFKLLKENKFDLVITMFNIGKIDAFEKAKKIKARYANIPIVVLAHFSREVSIKFNNEDLSLIDYVFCWLGNTSLLLAIIKLLEDKMNAKYDVLEKGVQAILLVEDTTRYFSSYLPIIYQVIYEQNMKLMTEGLNEHQKALRMRVRPKVLLAQTYENAVELYHKYKHNLLGVISDVSYSRQSTMDKEAGVKLANLIRKDQIQMPILLQSSDKLNEDLIKKLKVTFINKYSKNLLLELKNYIKENYGFGDFVFRDPDTGMELDRADNLNSLQNKIKGVDTASLLWHFSNNHFSHWLKARGLFSLSNLLATKSCSDFSNIDESRNYILNAIINCRMAKGHGIIASRIDKYAIFTRLGDGQLGGKGRGLAFIDSLIKEHKLMYKWKNTMLAIPRTFVFTTDFFDEFMEKNDLYELALSNIDNKQIIDIFSKAELSLRMKNNIKEICKIIKMPLAIRSSSLLEDSHYHPFAGVYSTFMIPNNHNNKKIRDKQLEQAIKSVYASVFLRESKAYCLATSNVIDEEKMAVVIQDISGSKYDDRFYPTISGTGRSVNFYPIESEKTEDGVAFIAFGLGKTIASGGISVRFCPKYPKKILQLSTSELSIKDTQKEFYALNLNPEKFHSSLDETVNLHKLKIRQAVNDKAFKFVASTYDYQDLMLRDGLHEGGMKIISFSSILKFNTFPLAEILQTLLNICKKEMDNQIEIEFSVNLDTPPDKPKIFHFLQIRPIIETEKKSHIDIEQYKEEEIIISSDLALGNGIFDNIFDIVYVKPKVFDPADTKHIAQVIDKLNSQFIKENKNYILIGPGRWGSSDPWLGIPIKWAQISAARLIIESGLKNFQIDPSQGSHFFQNLTSFNVGYFTIYPFNNDGFYDVDFLDSQNEIFEEKYVRHVRFKQATVIKIDGRNKKGLIYKPIHP